MDFSLDSLWSELDARPGGAVACRFCIALSGGLDSTVLARAMSMLAPRLSKGSMRAVHVHHGLHADATAWAERSRALCRSLQLPCEVLQVDARPGPGESPEASAREARYGALRAGLSPAEVLLTAHHADDQLETVLIQLLRGSGVAGLAAMPREAAFGAGFHLRPLLTFTRQALETWARAHGVRDWVEDPANSEPGFPRNHLRRHILPALRAHWPGATVAVARTARHCAEAASLLDELGAIDAAHCADGEALNVSAMRALSPARCRNLVRWQARRLGLPVPDERRLATLLGQCFEAAADAQPEVRWPGVVARRHANCLWLIPQECLQDWPGTLHWPDPRRPLALGAGRGTLLLEPTREGGLRPEALSSPSWRVFSRRGGERLRLPDRAGSRSLKKLLHAAGVPPWLRTRMPLVEIDGSLAAVADLWVDEAWWTPRGTEGWRLAWKDCGLPGRHHFIVGRKAF